MRKYKPIILRILSVAGIVLIAVLLLTEDDLSLEYILPKLPKIGATVAALVMVFVSTFFSKTDKRTKAQIDDKFAERTAVFTDREKAAKRLFYRGYRAYCTEDIDSAEYHLNRALKKAKTPQAQAVIYTYLADCARENDRYTQALADLEKATALDRTSENAWCSLAELHYQNGDLQKARAVSEMGLLNCPQSFALLSKTGHYSYLEQDYEHALRDFRAAQRIAPTHPVLAADVAVAYAGLGDEQNARSAYEHAKRLGYQDCAALLSTIESLLRSFEARKVRFTGHYVLETAEGERIEDCSAEQLYAALQNVFNRTSEFLVLTPPAPIDNVLFMQTTVGENGPYVQISVGENRIGALYEKTCSAAEVQQMFMEFLTDAQVPSLYGFTELQSR